MPTAKQERERLTNTHAVEVVKLDWTPWLLSQLKKPLLLLSKRKDSQPSLSLVSESWSWYFQPSLVWSAWEETRRPTLKLLFKRNKVLRCKKHPQSQSPSRSWLKNHQRALTSPAQPERTPSEHSQRQTASHFKPQLEVVCPLLD